MVISPDFIKKFALNLVGNAPRPYGDSRVTKNGTRFLKLVRMTSLNEFRTLRISHLNSHLTVQAVLGTRVHSIVQVSKCLLSLPSKLY